MSAETDDRDPRIYMAAERTFLAWIRTGLALMAFGFVVARVAVLLRGTLATAQSPATQSGNADTSLWLGIGLVATGIATCIMAAFRNAQYVRAIDRGKFRAAFGPGPANAVVVLLTLVGVVILLTLARG